MSTFTFQPVPPPLTQTQFNAERQAIADKINGITLVGVRAYPYSYLIRKNGAVYEAIDHTANLAYGGSGNAGGVNGTDAAAVIKSVAAAMPNGKAVLFKEATYELNAIIDFTKDITIRCEQGTVFKWVGGNTCMFYNSVPIHLRWKGGVIDQNSIGDGTLEGSCYALGFGGYAAGVPETTGQGDSRLLSCIAEDIEFRNIMGGAWIANQVNGSGEDSNTNMVWRNFTSKKCAGSSVYDMFQCVGRNVKVENVKVNLENAPVNTYAWTSAWIKNGDIEVYVVDDNNAFSTHRNIALEVYVSNGPFPNIENVKITANGQIFFLNGNVEENTQVARNIWIHGKDANHLHLGANYDQWCNIKLTGNLKSIPGEGLDKTLMINNILHADIDVVIDAENLTSEEGVIGIITIEGSVLNDYIFFKRLVVKNAVAGCADGIIAAGAGALVGDWIIESGDITDNVGIPLFKANHKINYFGQGVGKIVKISNVRGHATENSGTVTMNAQIESDNIPHGLAEDPIHIFITPQDQTPNLWYEYNPGDSYFTIHAADTCTAIIHWKAYC